MGPKPARRFRPTIDSLEPKVVLSTVATAPIVASPTVFTRSESHQILMQIDSDFEAFEGPIDGTINAISSLASGLVSTLLSSNSTTDPNSNSDDSSYSSDSTGDGGLLESRLKTALDKLPGGQAEASSLIQRTFAYGGLDTDDADYFRAKLSAMVRHDVREGIESGTIVRAPHPAPSIAT